MISYFNVTPGGHRKCVTIPHWLNASIVHPASSALLINADSPITHQMYRPIGIMNIRAIMTATIIFDWLLSLGLRSDEEDDNYWFALF